MVGEVKQAFFGVMASSFKLGMSVYGWENSERQNTVVSSGGVPTPVTLQKGFGGRGPCGLEENATPGDLTGTIRSPHLQRGGGQGQHPYCLPFTMGLLASAWRHLVDRT